MIDQNYKSLLILPLGLLALWVREFYFSLNLLSQYLLIISTIIFTSIMLLWIYSKFSPKAKERRKKLEAILELPTELLKPSDVAVTMGEDLELEATIQLPDNIRTRHVHILGATGSGKTESVILNFLRQDVARGLGTVILDAKGDQSFLSELENSVPAEKLRVFDLSSEQSLHYDPLACGTPLEASQRLFSSLTWSEEYYKSKALSALQRIFQTHFNINKRNPRLKDVADYLETPKTYATFVGNEDFPKNLALSEFQDLSGLRDQIRSLTLGHLAKILSPEDAKKSLDISEAVNGTVFYFRLQSLMSPQLVSILGKLLINNLNFLAGTAHRERIEEKAKKRKLVPVYLDEFASFACPEFADLISKARSAGFALHFSHQSIGDLTEVSPAFLNRITDNAATKIVMRINDPDSSEFFARSFGTKIYQKATQRITKTKDLDSSELVGEGTVREAHQFRASPDLLKTLPTGVGAVLVAHGQDTPHGASSVFTIKFPRLLETKSTSVLTIL